ncbi:MAG: hypothetical protein V2A70_00095 [Candidatus Omnitrophota bacterium]
MNFLSGEVFRRGLFRIIITVLLAYICLLPFYYFPYFNFIGGYKLPLLKYFPLGLIFCLLFLSLYYNSAAWHVVFSSRMNRLVWMVFLATLLSGLGTFYYPISVMKNVYFGMTGIMVYFILISWQLKKPDVEYFLNVFVVIGGIVSVYGIISFLLGRDFWFTQMAVTDHIAIRQYIIDPLYDNHLRGGRISSTLSNPHVLGTFLSFVLPFSIYCCASAQGRRRLLFFRSVALTIIVAILLTFSFGASLSAAAFLFYAWCSGALYGGEGWNKISRKIGLMLIVLLAGGVFLRIMGFVLIFFGVNIPERVGRFDVGFIVQLDRFYHRWDSIQLAWGCFLDHVWFGIGSGIISRGLTVLYKDNLDNFYSTAMVEYGIVPLCVMTLLFFVFIIKIIRTFRRGVANKPLVITLLLSWGSFFINMSFWDAYYHPVIRICFWFSMAMIFALLQPTKEARKIVITSATGKF